MKEEQLDEVYKLMNDVNLLRSAADHIHTYRSPNSGLDDILGNRGKAFETLGYTYIHLSKEFRDDLCYYVEQAVRELTAKILKIASDIK